MKARKDIIVGTLVGAVVVTWVALVMGEFSLSGAEPSQVQGTASAQLKSEASSDKTANPIF